MIEAYLKHESERKAMGIPPRPLDPEQTRELVKLLVAPPKGQEAFLLSLLRDRVSPGVDPAAEVKAAFLAELVSGAKKSPLISRKEAVELLGTMMGGYNVPPLVAALKDPELADAAAKALSHTTYVYDAFDDVLALSKTNAAAKKVIESWAKAEWFTGRPGVPETVKLKVFKVDGEINTDDFSPAGDASTPPRHPAARPRHGQDPVPGRARQDRRAPRPGASRSPSWATWSAPAPPASRPATRSSGSSARRSPSSPTRSGGGVIIGGVIAPIFFNTAQDSGALPIRADVTEAEDRRRHRGRHEEGRDPRPSRARCSPPSSSPR